MQSWVLRVEEILPTSTPAPSSARWAEVLMTGKPKHADRGKDQLGVTLAVQSLGAEGTVYSNLLTTSFHNSPFTKQQLILKKKNQWIQHPWPQVPLARRSQVFAFYFAWVGASLVVQLVKNPPATQETLVQFLDWEDPLEESMATHSSILAWRIPWTV